jgi:hypothetical protein
VAVASDFSHCITSLICDATFSTASLAFNPSESSTVNLRERHIKALRKKAKRGFAGYPTATVAFYGSDDKTASKVAVAIILGEDQEVTELKRWHSQSGDIRLDQSVFEDVLGFIREHGTKSVVLTDRIIGCPHEEGSDYPDGEFCPHCPFWAGRNRWTGEREH